MTAGHRGDGRPASGRGRRAARRARPLRPRRVDRRQHLRAGAGRRPARDQAIGRAATTSSRPRTWSSCDLDGKSSRAITRRRPTPPRRRTCTGTCQTSAASCTRTPPTRPPGPRRGEPIPCVLTMMADEFGGEIPIAPFALIGDEEIGRGDRRDAARPSLKGGPAQEPRRLHDRQDARGAVKAAVMCEDVARSVHFARQLGDPVPIAPDDIDALYDRYQNDYGQTSATPIQKEHHDRMSERSTEPYDLVPHRQPERCTARTRCARSRPSRRSIADALWSRCPPMSARVVWKPVLTTSDAIRRACLDANGDDGCIGVIAWMHTFSPAKMWIQGLDALRKPLLHLHTQANESLPVVDDRHGLHEPQPGRPRRPGVRLRADPPRHRPQDRRRPRHRSRGGRRHRHLGPGSHRRGGAAPAALARFGDNMRNVAVTEGDKVEAEHRFGVSVNTLRGQRSRRRGRRRRATPESTSWSPSTTTSTTSPPSCARAANGRLASAYAARHRGRHCGSSSTTAASAPSPRTSRTSAACASFPDSPSSGSWPTDTASAARATGRPPCWSTRLKAMADGLPGRHVVHGGLHVPPRTRAPEGARRPHARGVPVASRPRRRPCEIHPLSIGRPRGSGAHALHRRSRRRHRGGTLRHG